MQNITSTALLRDAIKLLEEEQAVKEKQLREQFLITYESLKPANILKNTLKDIFTSPNLADNILGSFIGLVTGYLSKKVFIGRSGNKIRKLIGYVMQHGISRAVSHHPDTFKSLGQFIVLYLIDNCKGFTI